jgi:hypothetical protein
VYKRQIENRHEKDHQHGYEGHHHDQADIEFLFVRYHG